MDNPGEILRLCRLCLVKDQVNIPIFEEQGDIRQIFLKISSCLPVKVSRDDQLPKKICDGCLNKLDLLYEFWNTSVNAEKTLLSWLGQAGVKDADEKISAVAQQIAKSAETQVKQEALEDGHAPEVQSFEEEAKDESEAPPPKRARRTAAVKAQINITPESDDDDDMDSAEAMTKVEDESDESDGEDKDPSYGEVPGTSADDQAGPSGVGKDGVEAPQVLQGTPVTSTPPINKLPVGKSMDRYENTYTLFANWCDEKKVTISEDILLEYFTEKSNNLKSSSLWSYFSMLKAVLITKKNLDIGKYSRLLDFLKKKSVGYKPTKSRALSQQEIDKFLLEAPDKDFLVTKVMLIIGLAGACSREDLVNMTLDDIEDMGTMLVVKIPNTKTNSQRTFIVVDDINLQLYRKYVALRPSHVPHRRLFIFYKSGKCTSQPIGLHTVGKAPRKVATYLKLSHPEEYTGHCFRRTSATLRAKGGGGDITILRRYESWDSFPMAEGYLEVVMGPSERSAE